MKTDEASLKKAWKHLDDLSMYNEALDVLSVDNYDASIKICCSTGFNHNNKEHPKEVKIPIDGLLTKKEVMDHIEQRIAEIKSEMEKL